MTERTTPLQTTASQASKLRMLGDTFKRIFDVVVSVLGLILLAPFFGVVAFWIKSDSPGPILFRGERSAKDGGTFQILKFRTMYERPESYQGPKVTGRHDPRVTPLGRWLRDTKLNELPQLWNVIKGEMSLVGPRPEDPEIVATWPEEVQREVLSVRPGITSPASVLYRNEEALLRFGQVMSTYLDSILPSKLRLDQLYVRYRSFWLDLDVLFWTFLVLLPRLGSYDPPEEHLFWGPVSRLIQRHLSWFSLDAITTFVAFGITGVLWRSFGPLHVGWGRAIGVSLGFSLLFSFTGAVMGANRIAWSQAAASDVFDLVPAAGLATLVIFVINNIFDVFPPGLVLMASVLAFGGFVVTRYRARLITGLASRMVNLRQGPRVVGERVLIVGGGEAGQFAAWILLNGRSAHAYQVVGFVDDDLFKQGVRIRGVNVVGRREDIPDLVREHDVGIIVFAIHNITPQERLKLIEICEQTVAQVVMLPDFLGILSSAGTMNGRSKPSGGHIVDSRGQISSDLLESWLGDLEELADSQDRETLLLKIRSLREQCRAHVRDESPSQLEKFGDHGLEE
jgi:lipopolysaccharide/colanic/teichoic acid biosynthesis glycosyltransferase